MQASVIIPAYNAVDFVERAILSALAQTIADIEIIVVDDCSTDGTYDLLQRISQKESRVTVYQTECNLGPSGARNMGFENASGKWIAVLDADDSYRPKRLEEMISYAEKESLEMVADNIVRYDQGADCEVGLGLSQEFSSLPLDIAELVKNDNPRAVMNYGLLKPIFLREYVEKVGVKYRLNYRFGEDFMFYAELLLSGARAQIITQAYYVYTMRVGPVSKQPSPYSRTGTFLLQLVEATDELLEGNAKKISPELKSLFLKRRELISSYNIVLEGKKLIKSRKYISCILFYIMRPCSWKFIFPALFKRAHYLARVKVGRV